MGGSKINNHAYAYVILNPGSAIRFSVMDHSKEWSGRDNYRVQPLGWVFFLRCEDPIGFRWFRGGGQAYRWKELDLKGTTHLKALWNWGSKSPCHPRVERMGNWEEGRPGTEGGAGEVGWGLHWSAKGEGKPVKHLNKIVLVAERTRGWEGLGRPVTGCCICLSENDLWGHASHPYASGEREKGSERDTEREKTVRVHVHLYKRELS